MPKTLYVGSSRLQGAQCQTSTGGKKLPKSDELQTIFGEEILPRQAALNFLPLEGTANL